MVEGAGALRPRDKFSVEKAVFGGVTLVTMHGTLNDAFEGRKLAQSIRTNVVVLNMREVLRFASWGMSEWMDFLKLTADRDVYLVECSTYAVSQLNLVTGLLGPAKLTSFYASYRCASCSEECVSLFLIPRDRATIRALPSSSERCPACSGRAPLEEYPAAFFDTIAGRPAFDIDDEALAYMRFHLKYELSPDLTRFRAFRRVNKDYAYLRLSGNLATLPGEVLANATHGTSVIDVGGTSLDPEQMTGWRTFVRAAMPKVKSLQLLNAPLHFLEAAVTVEDLRDKLKVRTFTIAHHCMGCEATTVQTVDVALNLEELVRGEVPPTKCKSCGVDLAIGLTPALDAIMRALPARDRDGALETFLTKAAAEPLTKLENCLTAVPAAKAAKPVAPTSRLAYFAGVLGVLLLGGLGVVGYELWQQHHAPPQAVVIAQQAVQPTQKPAFQRPEWIQSDVPSSGYCQDMINRLMCVGVSAFRANRDDGALEASDAALEQLVSSVGLKITDPTFVQTVVPVFSAARTKALSALQSADLDKGSDSKTAATLTAADDAVRAARKRVVEALQASGGAAVPAQRSDWYWEEYAAEKGKGTEFLVYVRFDVPLDAVKALVERYSATTPVLGASVMTAFPELAWQSAGFVGGGLVTKLSPALSAGGVAVQQVITAVGDQPVRDAGSVRMRIDGSPVGDIKLAVQGADGATKTVIVKK